MSNLKGNQKNESENQSKRTKEQSYIILCSDLFKQIIYLQNVNPNSYVRDYIYINHFFSTTDFMSDFQETDFTPRSIQFWKTS